MSGTQSTAQCVYHKQKRQNDLDNQLVTAIWVGHSNISCGKGIGIARIKPKSQKEWNIDGPSHKKMIKIQPCVHRFVEIMLKSIKIAWINLQDTYW